MPASLIVIFAIIALAAAASFCVRLDLIRLDKSCESSAGRIDAQQSARWNALEAICALVKERGEAEYAELCQILEKRCAFSELSSAEAISQRDNILSEAFGRVVALSERFPDLRTQPDYIKSMQTLDTYEESVRAERAAYNEAVTLFNRRVRALPVSLVAAAMGFKVRDYLDTPGERTQMSLKKRAKRAQAQAQKEST